MTYKEEGCISLSFHTCTHISQHTCNLYRYVYICVLTLYSRQTAARATACTLWFILFSEHDRRSYYYIIMLYNMMQTPHVRRDVISNFSPERTRCTRHPFYPVRIHRSTITLCFLRLAASSCVQVSAPGRRHFTWSYTMVKNV